MTRLNLLKSIALHVRSIIHRVVGIDFILVKTAHSYRDHPTHPWLAAPARTIEDKQMASKISNANAAQMPVSNGILLFTDASCFSCGCRQMWWGPVWRYFSIPKILRRWCVPSFQPQRHTIRDLPWLQFYGCVVAGCISFPCRVQQSGFKEQAAFFRNVARFYIRFLNCQPGCMQRQR